MNWALARLIRHGNDQCGLVQRTTIYAHHLPSLVIGACNKQQVLHGRTMDFRWSSYLIAEWWMDGPEDQLYIRMYCMYCYQICRLCYAQWDDNEVCGNIAKFLSKSFLVKPYIYLYEEEEPCLLKNASLLSSEGNNYRNLSIVLWIYNVKQYTYPFYSSGKSNWTNALVLKFCVIRLQTERVSLRRCIRLFLYPWIYRVKP